MSHCHQFTWSIYLFPKEWLHSWLFGVLPSIQSGVSSFQTVAILTFSGDKELLDFLGEEIVAETKQGKVDKLPSRIGDFDIKLDQAEVTLTKKHNDETYVDIPAANKWCIILICMLLHKDLIFVQF